MPESKIFILRNFAVDHIKRPLEKAGQLQGLPVEVTLGGYDNVVQDMLSLPGQPGHDLIVCSLTLDGLAGGLWSPSWSLEKAKDALTDLYALLEKQGRTRVALNTFVPPLNPWLPQTPASSHSGRTTAVRELNQWIRSFVEEKAGVFSLIDWENLAAGIGYEAALDPRFGMMMKAPFKAAFLELYATEIIRIVQAVRPRKKVLALDGDNTLWGGVVGELGPTNVAIDPSEYPGIAFYRLQFELLQLREQGVLLVACSKNNEADFWEVIEKHPHCLLKREHFAATRINWTDKAENLASMAEELRLTLDSFVFLDDNPAEVDRIRQACPDVTVLQVPEHLYRLPGLVSGQRLFDRVSLSAEDLERARLYEVEQQRTSSRSSFQSVDDFLRSLEMRADIHEMKAEEIERVSQLTQRTNQFNLTTRRYTETEIGAEVPGRKIFTLSVADRFGDLGLVGVAILHILDDCVEVDSFLLSCRVIGRKLEHAFLLSILQELPAHAPSLLRAAYRRTAKNAQVASLWSDFGLQTTETEGDNIVFTGEIGSLTCETPSFILLTANS